jgi:pimeloyl-ACP methyl ester carboxylesterase
VLFDKRGTGLSDRVGGIPTLEVRMDDVRAVMDAAGVERAAVVGISEGGPMTLLFAASHPERVVAAAVYGSSPPAAVRQPDFPWSGTAQDWDDWIEREERGWGSREWADVLLASFAPSRASDPVFRRWWETWLRMSVSPGAKVALSRMNSQIDVRHVLRAISVPTLVVHRSDDRACDVRSSRYLAERHSRRALRRAPGRGPPGLGGPRPVRGRDSVVPRGRLRRGGVGGHRAGAAPRDRALHRHRRVDGEGGGARRPRLA